MSTGSVGRIAWIDAARGIGIILVVAGHVERGLVTGQIAHGTAWSWIDYSVYTFHMQLFFLLAGLNVPSSLRKGHKAFLLAKIQTIAYPYVIWSVIQGAILVALSGSTHGQAHLSDLLQIGWRPMYQFWFLYVLLFCQFAAVLLATRRHLLTAVALTSLVASCLLQEDSMIVAFLHSLPFFALGILFSGHWDRWLKGSDLARSSFAAIGLAIAIPLSGSLDNMNFYSVLALPATFCGIVLLVSVSRMLTGFALRAAVALGRLSMTIYLLHILAAAGARILLGKLHVDPSPWAFFTVCTAVGVVGPIVAHILFDRLGLLPILGLASPRPATVKLPHATQSRV